MDTLPTIFSHAMEAFRSWLPSYSGSCGQQWAGGDELLRMCSFVSKYDHRRAEIEDSLEECVLDHILCEPADSIEYANTEAGEKLVIHEVAEDEQEKLVNSVALLLRGKYGLRKDTPLDREMGERAAREMLRELFLRNHEVMTISVAAAKVWSVRTALDDVVAEQRVGFH
jgi:hypothetical protein